MGERTDVHAALQGAGYRIDAVIGRGGMGTVYRAVQLSLQRDVALKLLSADRAPDTAFRKQFLGESIRTASLEHPNIVPVYDAGEADGIPYIAMRYVPGRDLQGMIRREGRLSAHASVAIFDQVASALDAAHANGLIHRDVKPSNVLIGGEQGGEQPLHAWLGDFGLSRRISDPAEETTERPLGTLAYVAPEQIRGEAADARADIYSLGCLLHECLTGEVPFAHPSAAGVLYAHLESPPPQVSQLGLGLPEALDEVIAWALAKAPGERPQSAGELARCAREALSGTGAVTRQTREAARSRGSAAARRPTSRRVVGRLNECEDLVSMLEDAAAGAGGVAMISGEAGIGKTTLARELAKLADQRGVPVVWGVGLSSEAARPYWHWIQLVRELADRREAAELFERLGPVGGWLATIVPDLEFGLPAVEPTDSDEGRFQVYDALLRLLSLASERHGLVVVLDDLHLADEASLLALSYISRAISDKRILIVGTHREVELEHARRETVPFGELIRPTHAIALRGLASADVRLMIESRRDQPPSSQLVERIHDQTGGNPLFISQLLSLLDAERALDDASAGALPLPKGVRDAISARLELLSPEGRRVLNVSAVIGRRFRTGPLRQATAVSAQQLLELVDEAVRLRLLRPLADSADGYVFEHGLIQATLYAEIPLAERMSLHYAVAQALEQSAAVATGEGLPEIAHHYLEAAPAHDPRRAVHYASRAGDHAMARYAYDQAVALYGRALGVDGGDAEERGALLQALGEAQMRVGDTAGARETLLRASQAALRRQDPVAFTRAVLGCGIWGLTFGVDEGIVGLAEQAVAMLRRGNDPCLLARVKGFLAAALYWTDQVERRERLASEALSLARQEHARITDRDSAQTLAYVLGRYLLAHWGPRSAERDLDLSAEMVELARGLGDGELELLVRNWRVTSLLELGRFGAVDAEIARVEQMAAEVRQPRAMVFLPLHHGLRAATIGKFEEAERLNNQSAEISRQVRGSVGELAGSAQLIILRLQQGRLPELEEPLRAMAAAHPEMVALRCALAALLVQAGRPAEAREELERLTAGGLDGLPKDCTHVLMLALVGEVAADLADEERAATIYEWTLPYRGRWVVSTGASALWPVDRSLGRLAVAAGRVDAALEHVAAARAQSERAGALPSVALCALDEARALQRRGRPEDLEQSRALVREALDRASRIAMGLVVDAAVALEVELDSVSAPSR